jgi:hypothetical protein
MENTKRKHLAGNQNSMECAYLNPRSGAATIAQKFMNKFSPISISDQSVRNIIKAHDYRYLSARKIQKLPEDYIVAEAGRPPIFKREEDIEQMREFNDGNGKRKWTYISRKLSKNYTPRIVEYRILLLNVINSINQGIEPDIEGIDPMDLNN